MRTLALVTVAVSVCACCLDVARDDACVVPRAPLPSYCFTVHQEDYVCMNDGPDPLPIQDPRGCPGSLYRDQDCGARGYTVRCWEDTYVRPGDPCAAKMEPSP